LPNALPTNAFAVEDMIKEVDVDGDGRIDFDEFVYALGEPEDSQEENEEDEEEEEDVVDDSDDSCQSPEPLPI